MGFDFAEDVDVLGVGGVFAGGWIGVEASAAGALEDSGVVFVSGEDAVFVEFVGVPDHLEQRFVGGFAVDLPSGVEDFVAAMFRVRLGEHHQFDIAGIAFECVEVLEQVIDLVFGESEAEFAVGEFEGRAAVFENGDGCEGARCLLREEVGQQRSIGENGLGHPIVDARFDGVEMLLGGVLELEPEFDGSLDPLDGGEAADPSDIGRFG